MKTKKEQNKLFELQDNKVSTLLLSTIDLNKHNPRKLFSQEELLELSESIKEKGVIQPILVRPIGKRFEIVYGERRFKASKMAGLETIPVTIKKLSNEEAEEYAIIENLHRKNISPLEEAEAFEKILQSKKNDISSICFKIGKSEAFIRGRLKLNFLIDDFKEMLINDTIKVGVAILLSNYSEDLQKSIYCKHFAENLLSFQDWKNLKIKELSSKIENFYSSDLKDFCFDKMDCTRCPFNTTNFHLFSEEIGKDGICSNIECLNSKNNLFLYNNAILLKNEMPDLIFNMSQFNQNKAVVDKLNENKYSVNTISIYDIPVEPQKENNENYETEFNHYVELLESFNEAKEKKEIIPCIFINSKNISIEYIDSKKMVIDQNNDSISLSDTQKISELNIMQTSKLENKIIRNNELCLEKKIEDGKKYILNCEVPIKQLCEVEENILYFFMLDYVRKSNFPFLDITDSMYLTSERKKDLIKKLSSEQKFLIQREFIIKNLSEIYGNSIKSNLLIEFIKLHFPNEMNLIENKYNETYNRRNEKLEEKIAELKLKVD